MPDTPTPPAPPGFVSQGPFLQDPSRYHVTGAAAWRTLLRRYQPTIITPEGNLYTFSEEEALPRAYEVFTRTITETNKNLSRSRPRCGGCQGPIAALTHADLGYSVWWCETCQIGTYA